MLNEVKFIVKDKTKLYNKIRLREILKGTKVMSFYNSGHKRPLEIEREKKNN